MPDETFHITIDGETVEARTGETVLDVCRRLGKDVPTLCHHAAIEPYAACRVCMVEIAGGRGRSLVPSCQYPVSEGLEVRTGSDEVQAARKTVLELLLARCPGSDVIRELAAKYGVTDTPYVSDDPDQTCILCGLCVRACEEVLGIAAIGFSDRGVERKVGTPFDEGSEVCIGCGACVTVCPTGHIRTVDEGILRKMETWNTELELAECETCGRRMLAVKQLDHVRGKLAEQLPLERICPACRRSRTAERMSKIPTVAPTRSGREGLPR
ncbi:MAG TPA: 2Fe-2S iron-sulfur cluster-binding protein [Planctomycetota bacterium]|nr:2Fe-2S iron-sulfur cluster-binding protein [Planctomycetota bacterium]